MVLLFWEVRETLGGGAGLEEVGHLRHVIGAVFCPRPFLFCAQLPVRSEMRKPLSHMPWQPWCSAQVLGSHVSSGLSPLRSWTKINSAVTLLWFYQLFCPINEDTSWHTSVISNVDNYWNLSCDISDTSLQETTLTARTPCHRLIFHSSRNHCGQH